MSPQEIAALKQHYDSYQAPAPKKTQGRGGFLSSIISELGGGGGAAGGAAIGSLLGPLGTIAGAGIGGLLGGFGGKAVEQKVRDDQNLFGAGGSFKKDLGEGALSGALSLGGEAFQAAKGARAASKLAKIGIEDGGKVAARQGVTEGIGQSLKSGAGGYGIGATAKGEEQLTAKGSKAVGDTLKALKIGAGSPESQAKALGSRIEALGSNLTKQYAQGAQKLTTAESQDLANRVLQKIIEHPDIGPNLTKSSTDALLQKAQLLAKTDSTSGLWKFAKDLSKKGINDSLGADAKLADREAINRIFRSEVRDTLNNKVPGVAATNNLFHDAKTAESFILNAAKDKGGGLANRALNLSPIKAAESKIGGGLETLGKGLAGTGGPITKVTNNLLRQAPGGLSRAMGGAPTDTSMPQEQPQAVDPTQDFGGALDQQPQQQAQQTYTLQNALMDSQRDPKNASQYLAYAKAFEDQASKQGTAGGPNITKVTAQQYGLAQRGSQSLVQLANLLQNDPNVLTRSATPGRKLPIVGGFISNAAKTGDFDAIGYNVASALLRLETGAQANESEIKNLQSQLMPRAGDSQETIQRKVQQLNQAFNTYLNAAGTDTQPYSQLAGAINQ